MRIRDVFWALGVLPAAMCSSPQAPDESEGVRSARGNGATSSFRLEMIQRLVGVDTREIDIYGTDLGVGFTHKPAGKKRVGLVFGDVKGKPDPDGEWRLPKGKSFANALAWIDDLDASKGVSLEWSVGPDGKFKEVFPCKRVDGEDASTVPAGAVSIGDIIYLYCMRATHWPDPAKPGDLTRAKGILLKSADHGETFQEVPGVTWGEDGRIVNAAPVVSRDGKIIYLFCSGEFRKTPIYLARVRLDDVEEVSKYEFRTGNGWASAQEGAKPIVAPGNVGELSVAWNAHLHRWVLMYADYGPDMESNELVIRTAPEPWGLWSEPEVLMTSNDRPDWYEENWGNFYGGYLLPELFQEEGRVMYFTLSLWRPYAVFLMRVDLAPDAGE